MSEKSRLASVARWSGISPAERTERMRAIALFRWKNATSEYRKACGERLTQSRKSKKYADI